MSQPIRIDGAVLTGEKASAALEMTITFIDIPEQAMREELGGRWL